MVFSSLIKGIFLTAAAFNGPSFPSPAPSLTAAEFEIPTIDDFFPAPFALIGTPFEMNQITLVRLIMTGLLLAFMFAAVAKARIVPKRLQMIAEYGLTFIQGNAVELMINSPKEQRRWTPMIYTVFLAVLFMNLAGVIPGLNIAGSAVIGIPLGLAVLVMGTYWYAGIRKHGFLGFIKDETAPTGVPMAILPIIAPIELLQLIFFRPFSLTVRLLANMLAGHILISLCINFTEMLATGIDLAKPATLLGIALIAACTAFELFVAFLQAYVFAILSASYIGTSVND
jgi:F-type H+-transporting ATPase subunit a